ncbi:MAG: DUF6497 family protein [Pararhodobacter sp.]
MLRFLALLACLSAPPAMAQERLGLPSGLEVVLHEILWDADQATARFRFIAEDIAAPAFDPAALLDDMETLCRDFALPILRSRFAQADALVLSVASAPSPFGASDSGLTQFFEGFEVEGDNCIWSAF